jgi:hypothetical protein
MTDILHRIDEALAAVVGCARCGQDLGDSPSADFCSPGCQELWHRVRAKDPAQVLREEDAAEATPVHCVYRLTTGWIWA